MNESVKVSTSVRVNFMPILCDTMLDQWDSASQLIRIFLLL